MCANLMAFEAGDKVDKEPDVLCAMFALNALTDRGHLSGWTTLVQACYWLDFSIHMCDSLDLHLLSGHFWRRFKFVGILIRGLHVW